MKFFFGLAIFAMIEWTAGYYFGYLRGKSKGGEK